MSSPTRARLTALGASLLLSLGLAACPGGESTEDSASPVPETEGGANSAGDASTAGDARPGSTGDSSSGRRPGGREGIEAAATLALVGGRVIDGFGGPPIEDAVVLIEDGRILAVGPMHSIEIPATAELISTEGMTVLPGLFDMHVHLKHVGHGNYERWEQLYGDSIADTVMPIVARQLLHAGVTSARDMGAAPDDILAVKERIETGEIEGPRLFVSGPFLQDAPYAEWESSYRWGVRSPSAARQTVSDLAARGVDFIKLIDQDLMEEDVVAAIVSAAHDAGLPVIAHAHRAEEIRVGLRHGVDGFEHTGLGTAPGYPEDVLAALRERNTALYWTPTVSPLYTMRYTGEVFPERLDEPGWRDGMPEPMVNEIFDSLSAIPHLPYYALFPSRIPLLPVKFRQLRETGVRLLIGTDSGIPTMFHNDSTWREMVLWTEFGVPPMEVLQAATLWPARALGVQSELGALAAGMLGDVIAVRGDPLSDMSVMREVAVIVARGRRVE